MLSCSPSNCHENNRDYRIFTGLSDLLQIQVYKTEAFLQVSSLSNGHRCKHCNIVVYFSEYVFAIASVYVRIGMRAWHGKSTHASLWQRFFHGLFVHLIHYSGDVSLGQIC